MNFFDVMSTSALLQWHQRQAGRNETNKRIATLPKATILRWSASHPVRIRQYFSTRRATSDQFERWIHQSFEGAFCFWFVTLLPVSMESAVLGEGATMLDQEHLR